MYLRDDYIGCDSAMWHEAFWRNDYRAPEKFEAGDCVFDIGAHIGSFTRLCLARGCRDIVAVEADLNNFEQLQKNMDRDRDKVELWRRIAWRSDIPRGWLSMRPMDKEQKYTTAECCAARVPDDTYTDKVETIGLDNLIHGPVRLLKIDAESAEYPILYTSRRLFLVQAIALEYHSEPLRDESGCGDRATPGHLADYLREQHFKVEWELGKTQGLMFASRQ